jgi:DNA-damage-inducible protein J
VGNNTALVQVRVEPKLKAEVESILNDNGLDIPTAVRMFFTKVRLVQGLPFEVRTDSNNDSDNDERIAPTEVIESIPDDQGTKTYKSFTEILAEVKAELAD